MHLFQLAVGDGTTVAAHLLGELLHEPRLPDARRSGDQHAGARAGASPAPESAQLRKLGVAPDQRGASRLLPRGVERRVLAQDRLVQPAQVRAGLDADLLDQRGARFAVGLQRLGLAARAVERKHALCVQALAQRLPAQQRLELRQHLAVAPGVEVLVDRDLERGGAQLFEAPDLRSGERLIGDVGQGRATPQRQRLARSTLGEQPLEAGGVHPVAAELQLVAAPARGDRVVFAVRRHGLAQVGHVELHHLGRGGRGLVAPQPVDQPLGRDGRAGIERQQRKQGARLGAAEGHGSFVRAELDGSEKLNLHVHPGVSRYPPYVRTRVLVHSAHGELRWV